MADFTCSNGVLLSNYFSNSSPTTTINYYDNGIQLYFKTLSNSNYQNITPCGYNQNGVDLINIYEAKSSTFSGTTTTTTTSFTFNTNYSYYFSYILVGGGAGGGGGGYASSGFYHLEEVVVLVDILLVIH